MLLQRRGVNGHSTEELKRPRQEPIGLGARSYGHVGIPGDADKRGSAKLLFLALLVCVVMNSCTDGGIVHWIGTAFSVP